MISFNLQSEYFQQEEMNANYDPPPVREEEAWEVLLAEMKVAILRNQNEKARKLMYDLEFKIHETRLESYRKGFEQGLAPLPF